MSVKEIRTVLIGAGSMGRVAIGCMLDHNVKIVGAVGNRSNIGADIGTLIGRDPIGIPLEKGLEEVLDRTQPNIALVTTQSGLSQVADILRACITRKINVITIAEEAVFPWNTERELATELDELCKANGVSLYGTGTHDVFWSNLCLSLASASNKITQIRSVNMLPLEGMGPVVAEELYLGKTLEEYAEMTKEVPAEENPLAVSCLFPLYSNCSNLHLHPTQASFEIEPILADQDVYVDSWDMTIRKGTILGLTILCRLDTEENIPWIFDLIFKVTTLSQELPSVDWYIDGDPGLHLQVENMKGDRTTAISAVNRIPDVIAAEPGFLAMGSLPAMFYRQEPMENYL